MAVNAECRMNGAPTISLKGGPTTGTLLSCLEDERSQRGSPRTYF